MRFTKGINGTTVDVIEEGGSFFDADDYLGKIFFTGADVSTVKSMFNLERTM